MLEAQRYEPALLMETFKREHFEAEHSDQTFPVIERMAEPDAQFLRNEWNRKLDVEPEADPLTLLNAAEARSEPVDGAADEKALTSGIR